MRTLANVFLILFLADGALSLGDELFSPLPVTVLSGLRNTVAGTVVLLTGVIYLCLGIDRRLPKAIFLPPAAFVFWSLVGTWLFPALGGSGGYGAALAAAQLSLGVIVLRQVRVVDGGSGFLFTGRTFHPPMFGLKNTLVFAGVNLLVLPPALALLLLSSASRRIDEGTAGFVRLAPDGLYMTERVYRKRESTIRLAGMIHFGEKGYYDDMAASVPAAGTIILAEGVTDREGLLRNRIGYGKMAGFLGLTSQETMRFRGRLIDPEELEKAGARRGQGEGTDILRADVDMKDLSPSTVGFLDMAGKQLAENDSLLGVLVAMNSWAGKNMTPAMQEALMEDILHRRNLVLIGYMDRALAGYGTVVIPWGALHMPEIERAVLDRGFALQEERQRLSIDFRKLLIPANRPAARS